jgi:hypothetical protein
MYNHIPGHGSLTRKDLNVVAVMYLMMLKLETMLKE